MQLLNNFFNHKKRNRMSVVAMSETDNIHIWISLNNSLNQSVKDATYL